MSDGTLPRSPFAGLLGGDSTPSIFDGAESGGRETLEAMGEASRQAEEQLRKEVARSNPAVENPTAGSGTGTETPLVEKTGTGTGTGTGGGKGTVAPTTETVAAEGARGTPKPTPKPKVDAPKKPGVLRRLFGNKEGVAVDTAHHDLHQALEAEKSAAAAYDAKHALAKRSAASVQGIQDQIRGTTLPNGTKVKGLEELYREAQETARTSNTPQAREALKKAQQNLLAAETRLTDAKIQHTALAREVGDLKINHNNAIERVHETHTRFDSATTGKPAEGIVRKPLKSEDGKLVRNEQGHVVVDHEKFKEKGEVKAPTTSAQQQMHEKRVALDVRADDLHKTKGQLQTAQQQVSAVDTRQTAGRTAAETSHSRMDQRLGEARTNLSTLQDQQAKLRADAGNPELTAKARAKAFKDAKALDKPIGRAEAAVTTAEGHFESATQKLNKIKAAEQRAAQAVEGAHGATTKGRYTGGTPVAGETIEQTLERTKPKRQSLAKAKARMADIHDVRGSSRFVGGYGAGGMALSGDAHYTPRPDASVHPHTPASPGNTTHVETPHAAPQARSTAGSTHVPHTEVPVQGGGAGHVHNGSGAGHVHTSGGAPHLPTGGGTPHVPTTPKQPHWGARAWEGTKSVSGKVKNAFGKGLLVTGLAAGALFALPMVVNALSSNRAPSRSYRNETFDEPVVFNPGADVGVGALAVPQIGQNAGVGNWAANSQPDNTPGVPNYLR